MIYLLEDDDSIRELVCYTLEKTGSPARGFAAPSAFYKATEEQLPELIILDVMLPEEDGFSVLEKIRGSKETADIPIIMLTAKNSEFDKVKALDAGADDYITKPFGIMELVARVKAVMRRYESRRSEQQQDFSEGGLVVCAAGREVLADGVQVPLTYKEFELLAFLIENRGSVVNRDRILREIWGYEFDGENRTVDVHVRTLRQKLGAHGDIIETVRGIGYKISAPKKQS